MHRGDMSGRVQFLGGGPAISVQDLGRAGFIGQGLSRGGAMDRLAVLEATALLGAADVLPAFEMAGMGGRFEVQTPSRFALTGAPMQASIAGRSLVWNASHILMPGDILSIGGVTQGSYGYLTFAGGLNTPRFAGSCAAHIAAGIGGFVQPGDAFQLLEDPHPAAPSFRLDVDDRFSGGRLRFLTGPQTELFAPDTLDAFLAARFQRSATANRQGVRLDHETLKFAAESAAGLASDFIQVGDIQQTGDGVPYVLMAECQTTGGYPRIGTVFPMDLPKIAQAPRGADIRFEAIDLATADQLYQDEKACLAALRKQRRPLVRDPKDIPDLLSYQLISGVTAGDDLERNIS